MPCPHACFLWLPLRCSLCGSLIEKHRSYMRVKESIFLRYGEWWAEQMGCVWRHLLYSWLQFPISVFQVGWLGCWVVRERGWWPIPVGSVTDLFPSAHFSLASPFPSSLNFLQTKLPSLVFVTRSFAKGWKPLSRLLSPSDGPARWHCWLSPHHRTWLSSQVTAQLFSRLLGHRG